ncbi:MAG TPA: efflux RND transporter periplasmic adaptor subunit [Polyangiaceae bacterium]|nr:efflux RND transporter periplasmic adaptor subunit [Polyangiaceae bacterium]
MAPKTDPEGLEQRAVGEAMNSPGTRSRMLPLGIAGGAVILVGLGVVLLRHAESNTNTVSLSNAPKLVTAIAAAETTFRASRTYVGTIEPWVRADVGPQLVSAYVDTVLVRPGAAVKKGDVLATLDCRNASATSQAVAMQARALEAQQKAVAHEAARVQGLLDGGFVSPNEAEQKTAQSAAQQAQLLATQAKLLGSTLEVNDCVLRSPFDGEVATRAIDPGAFVRPGRSIVAVVDRSVVRVSGDAPEVDFDVVAPGTEVGIRVLSTGKELVGKVARRAPAADDATRTVHFEIDVPNPDRSIPVGTTGELRIDVGDPVPAVEVPLLAASVRGSKASVFVVENGIAHTRVARMLGERGGKVYLEPTLKPGSLVVTEGRALLNDGDKVAAEIEKEGGAGGPPRTETQEKPLQRVSLPAAAAVGGRTL